MIREIGPTETKLAYPAMLELRGGIGVEDSFVQFVDRYQRPEGYRLVGAFVAGDTYAVAVAGFRRAHFLAWGHVLYCDDLSTRDAFRGQGHGGALIDWMVGCDGFHLDSGVGLERQDAHRLYFNKRMRISAYHFAVALKP
jgi:hypothetical protein